MSTQHPNSGHGAAELAGGLLLIGAAIAALLAANGPLADWYHRLLDTTAEIRIAEIGIEKPLLLWVNDGLMAVFFFVVGLELKRELLEGQLSSVSQVILPAAAAVGGMAAPALVFAWFTAGDARAIAGWAIPSATDIAFALGVLSLFGPRVPPALKVFLLSVAIIDDLGAIIVIALFYTASLSPLSMVLAGSALAVLLAMNRFGVTRVAPYLFVGFLMWSFVLKSGVHASLAGVLLALTIPCHGRDGSRPTRALEHELHPWVVLVIVPLFAFANAGLPLGELTRDALFAPVTLGIAAGLFLGKQVGVFGVTWLLVTLRVAKLPAGVNWAQMYGLSLLCGIGFTMSLFIATLAYDPGSYYVNEARLGILLGTGLSAAVGVLVLARVLPRSAP
jgi:NhaA family Na+:H+ antiporter